jgi:hypothetical protein
VKDRLTLFGAGTFEVGDADIVTGKTAFSQKRIEFGVFQAGAAAGFPVGRNFAPSVGIDIWVIGQARIIIVQFDSHKHMSGMVL